VEKRPEDFFHGLVAHPPRAAPMTRHLILFPTDMERRLAGPLCDTAVPPEERPAVRLCGFGLAAAAARTAQLLAELAPGHVILAGIAGRFDAPAAPPPGSAASFDAVACHGIGVGSGAAFTPAAALGWPQWPGDPPDPAAAIGDVIACPPPAAGVPRAGLLLTVAAAAADAEEALVRRRMHPAAVAEDMEGYAVALACRLAGVPCTIVRGFSNTVGDRDKSRWRIEPAVAAAAAIVRRLIGEER
jgi:futalosine hydrolase